jgi:hypothetical protein
LHDPDGFRCPIQHLKDLSPSQRAAYDLSEAEQVAQRFATQLTASRRIDDDLFAAAKNSFGLKGLVDLINLIGAYQTVCGLLNGFAVPAPKG